MQVYSVTIHSIVGSSLAPVETVEMVLVLIGLQMQNKHSSSLIKELILPMKKHRAYL